MAVRFTSAVGVQAVIFAFSKATGSPHPAQTFSSDPLPCLSRESERTHQPRWPQQPHASMAAAGDSPAGRWDTVRNNRPSSGLDQGPPPEERGHRALARLHRGASMCLCGSLPPRLLGSPLAAPRLARLPPSPIGQTRNPKSSGRVATGKEGNEARKSAARSPRLRTARGDGRRGLLRDGRALRGAPEGRRWVLPPRGEAQGREGTHVSGPPRRPGPARPRPRHRQQVAQAAQLGDGPHGGRAAGEAIPRGAPGDLLRGRYGPAAVALAPQDRPEGAAPPRPAGGAPG